jgi:hypothetical protein
MTLSEIGSQGGQKYKYAPCPFCGGQPELLTFEDSPNFLCCENGHNTVCMEPGEWERRAGQRTPAEDAVLRASVALQRTRATKPVGEDEETDEYGEWQDALWRALEAHKAAVESLPPNHPVEDSDATGGEL